MLQEGEWVLRDGGGGGGCMQAGVCSERVVVVTCGHCQ